MDTDVSETGTGGRGRTADGTVVRLFGDPCVDAGGLRQEAPEGSKQLLAFVALRRRRVGRPQAAETLWPDATEARAAGNLRSALWRLRRAGIDVLAADRWSLSLRGHVRVDLDLMDQWATRMISGTESAADLAVAPPRADTWEVLPGWDDDWVLMERERLRQRMLHALEALSGKLVRAGRFADAVEAAIVAVSVDPLRESAQRALTEAHLAEGNQSEARRTWRDYRDLLRRELGVNPSGNPLNRSSTSSPVRPNSPSEYWWADSPPARADDARDRIASAAAPFSGSPKCP